MNLLPLIFASGAGILPLFGYTPLSTFLAMVCFIAAHEEKKKKTPRPKKIRYLNLAGIGFILFALFAVLYLFPHELGGSWFHQK